jgi:hypothetical protein
VPQTLDASADGVSQASEFKTLSGAGISLTPTNRTNLNLGNGNTITGQAVATCSGGSTTTVGSVSMGQDIGRYGIFFIKKASTSNFCQKTIGYDF